MGFLEDYRKYSGSRQTAATVTAYSRGTKKLLAYCQEQGIESFEDTTPGLLDDIVTWMVDDGLHPSTIRLMMTGVRSFLDWRLRQGDKLPTYFAPKLPRKIPIATFVLTMEQLTIFFRFAAERPEPARTALMLMPLCGLRSCEMMRLSLDNITTRGGWVILQVHGKGDKQRSVPLLKQGNKILRTYLVGWRAKYNRESSWVFPGVRNKPLTTRTIRHHMKIIREELGVSEITPHILRKSYLTMLDRAGISPFKIAQIAGHASLRTTNEHYIHHQVEDLIKSLITVPRIDL